MKIMFAAVSALSLAASAQGMITGFSATVTQLFTPPVANFPSLTGSNAFAWDEQQNLAVTGVFNDMTLNPSTSTTPTPGVVTGIVDSHFIHFSHVPSIVVLGSVTFQDPIVGVMFNDTLLDNTDALLGDPGTLYPTGQPFRGMTGGFISIIGNTINFDFLSIQPGTVEITQVRVLTQPIPAPGAAALAGVGALLIARRRRSV